MLKIAYVSIPFHFSLIEKNHFVKKTNSHSEDELFIECITCHRKHHQVCAIYLENMLPKGFQCNACAEPPNRLKSKSLLKCNLSEYVETNVNNFLKTQMDGCSITVRVLSNENQFSEVKPEMQRRLIEMGKNVPSFPYRAKSIFAFQEVFGSDLCFFALYVHEYGSDSSKPNARGINIAYLDTVKFFEPANLRTMVYHKIILSYLDHSKRRGFENAYIWVSPPGKGSEYIFNGHPPGQQTMTHDILLNWYKNMIIKGKKDGTIESFNTLYEETIKKGQFCITDIPCFDGDFWPHVIEKKLNSQLKKKGLDTNAQVLSIMKNVRDSFLVIHLHSGSAQLGVCISYRILLMNSN